MNTGRADISMARGAFAQGTAFAQGGIDDGISIRENNLGVPGFEPPQHSQKSSRRPDMKGPVDISDILSGLKTKTIDISTAPSFPQKNQNKHLKYYLKLVDYESHKKKNLSNHLKKHLGLLFLI